jgi:DNA polymerase-3 subunit alpha
VAYQTAYMKAHYPVEYMTAVLTAESEYTDKIVLAINECNRMGIPVLPPDINTSETNFTIIPMENAKYKKAIRFGFSAVKNVGNAAIDSIITARNPVGEFKSFTHFFKLVDTRKVNKKVVESLIKVGGMDAFGKRAAMLAAIDDLRTTASKKSAGDLAGQSGLFDDNATQIPVDKLPDIPEFPQAELLGFEKQLLGLYLTKHPMAELLAQMAEQVTYNIADLDPQLHKGLSVTLGGIPTKIRTTMTKTKNQEMAFVTLEDTTGHIDVVIFPRTWETVKTMIQEDSPILISGKLDLKEDMLNLLASSARRPSIQAVAQNGGQSDYNHVLVIERGTPKTVLQQIGQILKNSPGKETVAVKLTNGEQSIKLMVLPYTVSFTPEINQQIQQLLQT